MVTSSDIRPTERASTVSSRAVHQAIAIDGPVAAGKTSVGRAVAARLGCLFLDTGAIYRALTYAAIQAGVDPDDGPALTALAGAHDIEVRALGVEASRQPASGAGSSEVPLSGPGYTVLIDGRDITASLRSPAVDANVSSVSAHAEVRAALMATQRRIAERGPAVLVGRDIGTIVLPDAGLKVFLVASAEERARRRYRERLALGEHVTWRDVLSSTLARDAKDAGRDVAPMVQADDAIMLDTFGLSFEDVVDRIVALAVAAGPLPGASDRADD